MFDYFDYIHESSQEDIDDVDSIYNETDLALAEFDSYVQEGIGIKIVAGLGIAALLGALIAVIIKVFGNRSDSNINRSTKIANTFLDRCERADIKTIVLKEKHIDLEKAVNIIYNQRGDICSLIRKISSVAFSVSRMREAPSSLADYSGYIQRSQDGIYSDLEKLKTTIDDIYGKSISSISNLFNGSETVDVEYCRLKIERSRRARKELLANTKKLNEYRKQIENNSIVLPKKHMELFEEVSTKITAIILELDNAIYDAFKQIINTCIKALKEKGQYKDGEKLSFEDEMGNAVDKVFKTDTRFVYDPKHYNSTLDEMKISDERDD
jgi:hypothetical protein